MNRKLTYLAAAVLGGAAFSAQAQNLIANSDFAAGNSGFDSEYVYVTAPTASENQYGVVSSPQSLHNDWIAQASIGTCTGGVCGGDMLVANGGPTANHVWYQTITVTPNTPYQFSAWVTSVLGYTDPNPANLSIGVDLSGACAGTPLTNTFTTVGSLSVDPALASGQWAQGTASFTSGTSTSICLSLANNQLAAGGNDFAIDGLSLTATATAPTANADAASTTQGTAVTVAVLGNDTAVAPATLPAQASTVDLDPATAGVQNSFTVTGQGTFTVNADGSVTFTPVAGFVGTASTPYVVIDSLGNVSAPASITITVNALAAVPTLSQMGLTLLSLLMGAGLLAQRRRTSQGQ